MKIRTYAKLISDRLNLVELRSREEPYDLIGYVFFEQDTKIFGDVFSPIDIFPLHYGYVGCIAVLEQGVQQTLRVLNAEEVVSFVDWVLTWDDFDR